MNFSLILESNRQRALRLVLLLSLMITIFYQNHLFYRKIGWLITVLLCSMYPPFALYAAFFFSAFFMRSGFLPDFLFTIKHFHVVVMLSVIVSILRGDFVESFIKSYRHIRIYFFWIGVLIVSTAASLLYPAALEHVLRTNANILALVLASVFFISQVDQEDVAVNALLFLFIGVFFRILLAVLHYLHYDGYFLAENLFYNNHIGFVTCSSILLFLPTIFVKQNTVKQFVFLILLIGVFTGLVLSCSRTGWISFLMGYFLFCVLYSRISVDPSYNRLFFMKPIQAIILMNVVFFILITVVFVMQENVSNRILSLQDLTKLDYWVYTLNDRQNFGFLGYHRLHQFNVLIDIIKKNALFGVGFTHDVTDFHSLYLTILGGTGILGFGLFIAFCGRWIADLSKKLFCPDDGLNLYRLGALCSFAVWLIYSITETFIVQFHIWMIIMLGVLLAKLSYAPFQKNKKVSADFK